MRYRLLTLLLPLGLLSGCLHAGVPMRSAHMPADGAWRLGVNITLPGWDFEHGMNVRSGAAPMMMVPMPVFLLEDASWGGGAQPLMGLDLASDRAE